jgi:hypothetical protein
MTAIEISLVGILALYVVLSLMALGAAYRNGVTDGYGYSREPWHPGYAAAGDYLRKYLAHRWPELSD